MYKIGFTSFFRMPKPRQFNYRPMYYDADKEELQARIERIEAEVAAEKDPSLPQEQRLRSRIHSEMAREKDRQLQSINYRVLAIAGLLALAIYAFLYL
ncbi:MAG: hypothetical protein ACFB10_05370 [Salibacteraceae bacterium]